MTATWSLEKQAKKVMKKDNQQLVKPYITLNGGLDGVDFKDRDCRRMSYKQMNKRTGL